MHKCQILLWFWLSVPFRFLIGWNNKGPKGKDRPGYFQHMVKWGGTSQECKDVDVVMNHKLLYKEMVRKCNTQIAVVCPEVWARVQDKGLSNGFKDFNWLHLHKRLPVSTTMYAHKLGKKDCPWDNCTEEETIAHVLWDCGYAKRVWKGVKDRFECLRSVTYDEITSFGINGMEKQQQKKIVC